MPPKITAGSSEVDLRDFQKNPRKYMREVTTDHPLTIVDTSTGERFALMTEQEKLGWESTIDVIAGEARRLGWQG
jgi:hypothetical protein